MKWSEEAKKLLVISLILLVSLIILDRLSPFSTQTAPLTGYAVYETRQLQWTFDTPADYDYNLGLISVANGEAKLLLQKITTELKNDSHIAIKQKNNGDYEKKLEFKSAAYKYDGTLKKLYLEADKPAKTSIKLKIRTAATEEELENADWQPEENSYTESAQDITGVQNGYIQYKATLETDDKKTTPILKSVRITHEKEEYPESAAIATKETSFGTTAQLLGLATDESLNGQRVTYEHSTDSGSTWQTAIPGQATKITLRATLYSNKTETPAVKNAKLSYKITTCDENWQASHTACGTNDTKTKYYTDANSCGSTEDLPGDNGTSESCNYCTPQWTSTNSSCRNNDTLVVDYAYSNSCCQDTGLQSDCTIPANETAACDYCTPSFSCTGYGECNDKNQKTCSQVNDSNNCHGKTGLSTDAYGGNYSEFTTSCTYDSEPPSINSASASITGGTLTVSANVTDKSATTVTASLTKDDTTVLNLTLQNTSTDTYAGTASALTLKGAYIIAITAKDKHNNTQKAKAATGVAAEAEKSAVEKLTLNSSTNAALKPTNTTRIELRGNAETTTGSIVVSEHKEDIKNTTKTRNELKRYIEIEADEAIKGNISIATITLNYTDDEVSAANVTESSIALYFYNETATLWEQLNSTVNTALNYVEGNTTHLSLFGIFGNATSQAAQANTTTNQTANQTSATNATVNQTSTNTTNSTANSTTEQASTAATADTATAASGGSEGEATESETANQKTEEETKAPPTTGEKQECTYNIKAEVQDRPSFINRSEVAAKITNTGSCELRNLEVKAAPPLDSYITIENGQAAVLAPSESLTITIRLKPEGKDPQGNPIQGYAVKEPRKTGFRAGKIIITGRSVEGLEIKGKSAIEEEVSLNIEIYETDSGSGNTAAALLIGTLAAVGTFAAGYRVVKRRNPHRSSAIPRTAECAIGRNPICDVGKPEKRDDSNSEPKLTEKAADAQQEPTIKKNDEDNAKFEENLKRFEEKHGATIEPTGQDEKKLEENEKV
ncbi:hypothetical protein HYU18_03225 [Candidatus Woesearchaeota archaeon]|nr:hypothetical protein [Candidatus Woesearchaeota archaeon]